MLGKKRSPYDLDLTLTIVLIALGATIIVCSMWWS